MWEYISQLVWEFAALTVEFLWLLVMQSCWEGAAPGRATFLWTPPATAIKNRPGWRKVGLVFKSILSWSILHCGLIHNQGNSDRACLMNINNFSHLKQVGCIKYRFILQLRRVKNLMFSIANSFHSWFFFPSSPFLPPKKKKEKPKKKKPNPKPKNNGLAASFWLCWMNYFAQW